MGFAYFSGMNRIISRTGRNKIHNFFSTHGDQHETNHYKKRDA